MAELCSHQSERLRRLRDYAMSLAEPVVGLAEGLIHDDFYPGNTGWRRGTRELLVFDFEGVAFGPRFYDVARWLGAPDGVHVRSLARDELARYYLGQYVNAGGEEVAMSQFLAEIELLWMARTFYVLGPRLNDLRTNQRSAARSRDCDELHRELRFMLDRAA